MRSLLFSVLLFFGFAGPAVAQDPSPPADLREYFLVLLVNPGPERIQMPEDVFARHMSYMNEHYHSGVYKIAGPVTDGGRIRGVIVMETEDIAAAHAILAQDPAVLAGVLAPEVHPMLARDLAALDAARSGARMQDDASAPPPDLREYYLVMMVNPGPERIPMSDEVFARHMAYRNARVASGAYKTGGPVTDGGRIRGVSIVEAESVAAARAVAERDPAVLAGILTPEVHTMFARDLSALDAQRSAP